MKTNDTPKTKLQLVRRDAFICKYCEGVYADEPVTQCDCMDHIGLEPPHFLKGEIRYKTPLPRPDRP
jgi:hypothetical protein